MKYEISALKLAQLEVFRRRCENWLHLVDTMDRDYDHDVDLALNVAKDIATEAAEYVDQVLAAALDETR